MATLYEKTYYSSAAFIIKLVLLELLYEDASSAISTGRPDVLSKNHSIGAFQ